MPAGRMTLLRLVRALPEPEGATPRVLGIDEFALRRGRTYAVLLVDLEAYRPVDVLPEKSADAVAAWLDDYGSVQLVCRDRCSTFADGAGRRAPAAVQVVDRFNLLRHVAEAGTSGGSAGSTGPGPVHQRHRPRSASTATDADW